ncbi:hypothetical protein PR003_g27540 [Phytophthora rubi]|uniref:RxLR effector protein n=2 Tax=Phytophthora TaxID=4783 RepID=A0A6A3QI49_9STRA|nr:hypothetical protein PR001_g26207 [Phytophthora rubi]KAE9076612.1 hypothetical protein PF006_g28093 [Phytophthora fragariae]KAE9171591.1 hypothetical protein PF004_g27513 [Phytophthora fragariae]KAE9281928.1 hypothetical protein PR003_g27540 [Phytophthora rubi]
MFASRLVVWLCSRSVVFQLATATASAARRTFQKGPLRLVAPGGARRACIRNASA